MKVVIRPQKNVGVRISYVGKVYRCLNRVRYVERKSEL